MVVFTWFFHSIESNDVELRAERCDPRLSAHNSRQYVTPCVYPERPGELGWNTLADSRLHKKFYQRWSRLCQNIDQVLVLH